MVREGEGAKMGVGISRDLVDLAPGDGLQRRGRREFPYIQVVGLLAEGFEIEYVAQVLGVHPQKARWLAKACYERLGVLDQKELMVKVWRKKLADAQDTIYTTLLDALRKELIQTARVVAHLEDALRESNRIMIE